jgi:ribonuclease J
MEIIPMGGLGNSVQYHMAIRYGEDIVVVDAGLMFRDDMLGVDSLFRIFPLS